MGLLSYSAKSQDYGQPAAPSADVDYWELFKSSIEYAADTEVSWSGLRNNEMYHARNQVVSDKIKDGDVPRDIINRYNGDYNLIARWLNESEGADIPMDSDLRAERSKIIKERGERLAGMREGTDFLGKTIGFVGTMGAMVADFDVLAGSIIGGASKVYKGIKAGKAFKRGMVVGSVLEAPRQAAIWDNKRDANVDTNAKEVIANIVYAGLGEAAVIGATVKLASIKTSKVLKAIDGIEKQYNGNVPKDVATEIAHLRRELGSEISENAEEVMEGVQAASDKMEKITIPTPHKEAKQINEMVIEDRIEEIRREVLQTPERQQLVGELTDVKSYLKEIKKSGITEDQIDRVLLEDRLGEIRKKLDTPEAEEAYSELSELYRFTDEANPIIKQIEPKVKPVEEGVTAHPSDKFTFLDETDKAWVKEEGSEIMEELEFGQQELSLITDCLVGNGIKI